MGYLFTDNAYGDARRVFDVDLIGLAVFEGRELIEGTISEVILPAFGGGLIPCDGFDVICEGGEDAADLDLPPKNWTIGR